MTSARVLDPADDQLVHTGPGTLADPDGRPSVDLRFFERYWNVWHDDTGEVLLAVGGSLYPNLRRAEAYAIVNLRGDHRAVRAFRPMRDAHDRNDLTVGPLQPQIIQGMRLWRHRLDVGEWGFGYDLTVTDTHRVVYNAAWGPEVPPDGLGERHVTAGFEGFAAVTGWIQVGAQRIEWPAGAAHGTRDRHWGVGRNVGGPTLNGGRPGRAGWMGGMWIDLGDVAVWGKTVLTPLRDPRRDPGRVSEVRRRLRFEDDTQIFVEGVVELTFDDGSRRTLHLERLGHQSAYLRCGFYGGTPVSASCAGGLHHGEYSGPARVEWDRFDVTDPSVRRALRGLDEHHCRVRWDGGSTTGILQPLEPDAYQACVAGKPGWELL
ncbi:MAG: hypothetical protein ACT4P1_03950 [Sporichthyaceae bacterium]